MLHGERAFDSSGARYSVVLKNQASESRIRCLERDGLFQVAFAARQKAPTAEQIFAVGARKRACQPRFCAIPEAR